MFKSFVFSMDQRVVLGILSLALFVFVVLAWKADFSSALFEFDRQKIQSGEVWRIYTAHFTHFGFHHMVMNASGFAFLVFLFFWLLPSRFLLLGISIIPAFVGIFLYLFSGGLDIYRGFSGANYGFFAFGVLMLLPSAKKLYGIVYAALLAKIVYEQLPGYDVSYLQDKIGVLVAVEAHFFGFLTGTFLALVILLWRWKASQK